MMIDCFFLFVPLFCRVDVLYGITVNQHRLLVLDADYDVD